MLTIAFIVFIISLISEALLLVTKRKDLVTYALGCFTVCVIMFYATLYVLHIIHVGSFLLFLVAIFRVINSMRLTVKRMPPAELRNRSWRTYRVLVLLSGLSMLTLLVPYSRIIAYLVAVDVLFLALILFTSVIISKKKFKLKPITQTASKLPTVSVCIPARNETPDLPLCLSSVLQSSYPKLEVLVLDDCSHDKTPEVIKQFAHAGVRFIKGDEPTDGWLAKNAAYKRLASEAKGTLLLFCGVDVRFKPHTVTEIVNQFATDTAMISIMPKRASRAEPSLYIQPLRYWWEMALLRFWSKRPAVLSTCWAIQAASLNSFGGFDSVKKAISPEAHFARLVRMRQSYSFMISSSQLGLTSEKQPAEQYQTALRMRYPQLKRRPESVVMLVLLEAYIFILPLVGLVLSLMYQETILSVLFFATTIIIVTTHVLVSRLVTKRVRRTIGAVVFGIALVPIDWFITLLSMYRYEFDEVKWKERNICIPLLTIESKLPTI
jgi:hypothetical protein